MAMFNGNQACFMDENISLRGQQFDNSPSGSYQALETNQVIYSTLQPTAAEFQPSNSSNGAIKKEPQRNSSNRSNSKPNYYGSGRTFSNSRGYMSTHERPKDKSFVRDSHSGSSQFFTNASQNESKTSEISFSNYKEEKSHGSFPDSSFKFSDYSSNYQFDGNFGSRTNLRHNPQRNFKKQFHDYNNYSNSQQFSKSHWPSKSSSSNSFKKGYSNKKITFNKNKDRSRIDSLNNITENQSEIEDVDHRITESESHTYQSNKLSSNFSHSKYIKKNVNDLGNRSSFRRYRSLKKGKWITIVNLS